jgi:DNA-binding transcriptional regulator YhcF (GntR family)
MKYQTDLPIYIQVATDIKEQIMSGKLTDGSKLPSVRELSV